MSAVILSHEDAKKTVEILVNLFNVLDNTVLSVYYNYQKHNGEYPSEQAINALLEAKELGLESKVLKEMNDNLAKDI